MADMLCEDSVEPMFDDDDPDRDKKKKKRGEEDAEVDDEGFGWNDAFHCCPLIDQTAHIEP